MKQMKKIISLVLAFVMVMSVTAGIDFSALAADTDTDNKTVTSASFESSKGNDYLILALEKNNSDEKQKEEIIEATKEKFHLEEFALSTNGKID